MLILAVKASSWIRGFIKAEQKPERLFHARNLWFICRYPSLLSLEILRCEIHWSPDTGLRLGRWTGNLALGSSRWPAGNKFGKSAEWTHIDVLHREQVAIFQKIITKEIGFVKRFFDSLSRVCTLFGSLSFSEREEVSSWRRRYSTNAGKSPIFFLTSGEEKYKKQAVRGI
jgi:hypothetical protein